MVAAPSAPTPRSRQSTTGDRVRFVLRGVGQTLITLGLVVLLFAVYEVWITNIFAHRAQQKVYNALEEEWRNGQDPLALPDTGVGTIPVGSGIAVMYIPRLGADYHFAIVQGSTVPTDAELEKGPAHYADTQLPGEIGNFGIAGHRVGKGEPFLNLDKLRVGDAVIVETKTMWWVYRVLGEDPGSDPQDNMSDIALRRADVASVQVPGREIVDPGHGQVLLPIPNYSQYTTANATVALMTMTTCHPKFTASQRMIVHAELAGQVENNMHWIKSGTMPPAVLDLYNEVKV
jgi:sortase A